MRKVSDKELEADREYVGALFRNPRTLTGLAMIMAYALRDSPEPHLGGNLRSGQTRISQRGNPFLALDRFGRSLTARFAAAFGAAFPFTATLGCTGRSLFMMNKLPEIAFARKGRGTLQDRCDDPTIVGEQTLMRYALALTAIPVPLLMWASWPPLQPPVPVKPVHSEGIRAQRMDTETFRVRWSPMSDLAPAVVIHEVPFPTGDKGTVPVETVSVRPQPPPARSVRRASLRTDVCAKHGMRTVHYGKRWRCRK